MKKHKHICIILVISILIICLCGCTKSKNNDDISTTKAGYSDNESSKTTVEQTEETKQADASDNVDPNNYIIVTQWTDTDEEGETISEWYVVSKTADTYDGKMKFGLIKDGNWIHELSEDNSVLELTDGGIDNFKNGMVYLRADDTVLDVVKFRKFDVTKISGDKSFACYNIDDNTFAINVDSFDESVQETTMSSSVTDVYIINKKDYKTRNKYHWIYRNYHDFEIRQIEQGLFYIHDEDVYYNTEQIINDKAEVVLDIYDYGESPADIIINPDGTVSATVSTENGRFRLTINQNKKVVKQEKLEG